MPKTKKEKSTRKSPRSSASVVDQFKPEGQDALLFWEAYYEPLKKRGLLQATDLPMFQALATWYQQWRDAGRAVSEAGTTHQYTNKAGAENETLTPQYRHFVKSCEMLLKLSSEFGMTPVSRAKLGEIPAPDQAEQDDLLAFGFKD